MRKPLQQLKVQDSFHIEAVELEPSEPAVSSRERRAPVRGFLRSLLAAVGFVVIGANLAHGWPWSTDMDKQPSIRPQEDPRLPPAGSIPRQGKEPPMDRLEASEKLRNPVQPTAESVENGKQLFQIYCALCHGADGKGGGPVATKFVPPPDLTLEIFRQRTDGFLYGTIRNGGALMPGQAEALSPRERWDIVNYIRHVQGK